MVIEHFKPRVVSITRTIVETTVVSDVGDRKTVPATYVRSHVTELAERSHGRMSFIVRKVRSVSEPFDDTSDDDRTD